MAYNEGLGYHDGTQALIDRMCAIAEREDYELNKPLVEEKLLATFELFEIDRPKKIVWHVDLSRAWRASRALSASRAWRALSVDYDFDYFVMAAQYKLDPTQGTPNDDDKKYLQYSELLLEAKEAGAGYWFQDGDTLHIVPVPITYFDNQARFHREDGPAIYWKGGEELYYLKGEEFAKDIWQKIADKTMTFEEVMQIDDSDKREIAFSMLGAEQMLKGLNAKLIDTGKKDGTRLYECPNFRDTGETRYLMVMDDPGTPRQFVEGVPADVAKEKSADKAQAVAMGLTLDEYMSIELRA